MFYISILNFGLKFNLVKFLNVEILYILIRVLRFRFRFRVERYLKLVQRKNLRTVVSWLI